MRNFQRERRLTWYILLLESMIVLYALFTNYEISQAHLMIDVAVFAAMLIFTGWLTRTPVEKYSNFFQGAVMICCGVCVYLTYSIGSRSDRLLPSCMFFVLVECTMYKDMQLNIFVTVMNIFVSIITMVLSGLDIIDDTYSRIEFLFILVLMMIGSLLMLYMQAQDLFTARVAQEDEKSLDDLLQLVEMKCDDATAAAEAKSSFLANMSHEIRTPINAVLGMNEMILREERDEEIRSYAQNIQSAGTSLLALVNDILDFSKIESGKMSVVPEKYELNSLLYDALLVIQPRIEKKKLQLILDIDEQIPNELYGDEVRIRQIITNILTNAVKYTEKGSVTLSVQMEKRDVRHIVLKVMVKDTGIGIKESREVLFASFQRGGDLRAHHIEGTGLGLAITQELLEMMGSTLEMDSTYGEGSQFSFALEQTVIGDKPVGSLNDLHQKRLAQEERYKESFIAPDASVLVVDDNPMNRRVVKSLLKQTLVQIDTAEDGLDCIEKCAQKRYDLIFMDHLMPNMDGVETFHALRANENGNNFSTPIIILTANAVAGMKQRYLEEGFNGFLSKPVQGQLLEETLRSFLPPQLVQEAPDSVQEDTQEKERRETLQCAIDEAGLLDLSFEDALQYSSGTVEDVLDNISGYLNEAEKNDAQMSDFYEAKDWNNLKILVHALKSTSRVVGAVHLAYLAQQMEQAAGENDASYISENFIPLLQEHRQLCARLRELLLLPQVAQLLPQVEETEAAADSYMAQAQQFLQGVQEYEIDFDALRAFCSCYPSGNRLEEVRAKLAQAVDDFDYEEIEHLLEQLILLAGETNGGMEA